MSKIHLNVSETTSKFHLTILRGPLNKIKRFPLNILDVQAIQWSVDLRGIKLLEHVIKVMGRIFEHRFQ